MMNISAGNTASSGTTWPNQLSMSGPYGGVSISSTPRDKSLGLFIFLAIEI